MSESFLNKYLKNLREEYFLKEYEIINNSHLNIFTNKDNNTFISLKDILKRQHIIKHSIIQNEISSINEIGKDKYVIFHTSTIDPILNIPLKINNIKLLEDKIKKQYEEFSKYFRTITKRNNDKELSYKNIRVYELTKKFNLHCHKTDFLYKENDFIKYIESLVLGRNKNNIGRVELVITVDFFKVIEQYFKDKKIKIRINNQYEILTILKRSISFKKEKKNIYLIKESIKGKGNFIYFRTIDDNKGNGKHITDYMFKYMLKSYDNNKPNEILKPRQNVSKETLIFSKIKIRQKIYSTNFFTDKLSKDELEKINNKFYTLFKQNEHNKENVINEFNDNDLTELHNGKKYLFYTISKMFEDNKLLIDENKIYYFNNENNKKYLIHDFKSNYHFEKFHNDFELYEDLLKNKVFNNRQDELKTSIDYINTIIELLGIDTEPLTIEKVKEDIEIERMELRTEQNRRLTELIDDIDDDYSELIKYYYSLNYYSKIEFIQNNDEHIKEILIQNSKS
ncbi:MAG: hypothetical protein Q8S36_10050 [Sulfuricurvum sp.]|nr:hypothetical protein [Sulfuricurvum sp.]